MPLGFKITLKEFQFSMSTKTMS